MSACVLKKIDATSRAPICAPERLKRALSSLF